MLWSHEEPSVEWMAFPDDMKARDERREEEPKMTPPPRFIDGCAYMELSSSSSDASWSASSLRLQRRDSKTSPVTPSIKTTRL